MVQRPDRSLKNLYGWSLEEMNWLTSEGIICIHLHSQTCSCGSEEGITDIRAAANSGILPVYSS